MGVWRRMTVCSDVKGCLHLQANALRLDVSISWPTSAAEDLRARHTVGVRSGDCGFSPPLLDSPSRPHGCCQRCQHAAAAAGRGADRWRWRWSGADSRRLLHHHQQHVGVLQPDAGHRQPGLRERRPDGLLWDFPAGAPRHGGFQHADVWVFVIRGFFVLFFLFGSVSDIWLQLLGGTRSLSNRVSRLISCVIDR